MFDIKQVIAEQQLFGWQSINLMLGPRDQVVYRCLALCMFFTLEAINVPRAILAYLFVTLY